MILAAVAQTGERFGAAHIIDVLRGAERRRFTSGAMTQLASFGSGAARKKDEWQSLIRQLVAGGFLAPDDHGGLSIAEKGHALRRGESLFTVSRGRSPRGKTRSIRRIPHRPAIPRCWPRLKPCGCGWRGSVRCRPL